MVKFVVVVVVVIREEKFEVVVGDLDFVGDVGLLRCVLESVVETNESSGSSRTLAAVHVDE